ncbi:MAG: protein kinase [Polyangiales bacterium]
MTERAADLAGHELRPGDVVAGRYRIEARLGAGGMGAVWTARHVALGQRVALKVVLPEALRDAAAVPRFMREAWAASNIQSDHIVRVFDLGTLESGAPYLVMEHLEGLDLAQRLRQAGKLAVPEAIEIVLQVCEALGEAHALGVVHRDLKPSNIFCVQRGGSRAAIKVLDFGISKITAIPDVPVVGDLSLTNTRTVIGSPLYMSPEQMASAKNVDARADIWSLGVILYELLAGQRPFVGDTFADLAVQILSDAPRPLGKLRPELPKKLLAVVERCLEKQRDKRYADVGQLARALVAWAPAHAGAHAERAELALRRASQDPASTASGSHFVAPQPSAVGVLQPLAASSVGEVSRVRRRGAVVAAGLPLAAASAGLGWWLLGASPASSPVKPKPPVTVTAKPEPAEAPRLPVEPSVAELLRMAAESDTATRDTRRPPAAASTLAAPGPAVTPEADAQGGGGPRSEVSSSLSGQQPLKNAGAPAAVAKDGNTQRATSPLTAAGPPPPGSRDASGAATGRAPTSAAQPTPPLSAAGRAPASQATSAALAPAPQTPPSAQPKNREAAAASAQAPVQAASRTPSTQAPTTRTEPAAPRTEPAAPRADATARRNEPASPRAEPASPRADAPARRTEPPVSRADPAAPRSEPSAPRAAPRVAPPPSAADELGGRL